MPQSEETGRPARRPTATPPGRIAALAALPLFHKLDGRPVVVAGGTEGIAWKAELLAAAGARVRVFAPEPAEALVALSDAGTVALARRPWTPDDLRGAALAICDAGSEGEAAAFRCAARLAGVTVNIVDKPAYCDVQFGSIVNRSPLVIGISTDGAAPVFGQAVRARIEALLPEGFKRWAEAARSWRPAVQARELGFRARRVFWEAFTEKALREPDRAPTDADRDALFEALEQGRSGPGVGSVAFVGAGPGDPELVTLKAVRLLQSADVILYDDLVDPRILDLARREARRIGVGKRGHRASCAQDDIVAAMLAEAAKGARVVRLKGGDPAVFGRLGEEIAACRAAGLAYEVVPGITAAFGAAASLGLSLTHRRSARRLQFVTAHGQDGRLPEDLNWAALADPGATTVVYMGVRTMPALVARVLEAGLPGHTPAMVISSATTQAQSVLRSSVEGLPGLAGQLTEPGPSIIIIGPAAGEDGIA
ncbi:siroheme synthase CysG [uncultured Alsobacter sp.]|uniref:siroheme synthase CysG n=1 Tax=uncultured Alsobacter sp. TaxID=1748258 RepID=UPI0025D25F2E|nr:siroheme synthase CysG [uncultured Alsobacter sp.]